MYTYTSLASHKEFKYFQIIYHCYNKLSTKLTEDFYISDSAPKESMLLLTHWEKSFIIILNHKIRDLVKAFYAIK